MEEKKPNQHQGHRKKVKDRYLLTGIDGMAEHNILEMLLFFGIPRKDTNEIAHALIEKFGSFSLVLQASFADLKSVKGMTSDAACLITMLLPIYRKYLEDLGSNAVELNSSEEIAEYIKPKFLGIEKELIYAVCFDSSNKLICSRKVGEGGFFGVDFEMKKLASIILETNASSVVLVHNHLTSIAMPSVEDINATKSIYKFLQTLKVTLSDHIILAKDGSFCSMINIPAISHIFFGLNNTIID